MKIFKKQALAITLIVSLTLTLTACAPATEVTPTPTPTPMPESTPFATIVDQAGREVVLETQPETIVSGYYISSSILIGLGVDDLLVGVENKADTRNIYTLAAPQILELPGMGTAKDFNVEGTLALEPDLVILPLKLQETANTLTDMGVPTICVNPENNTLLAEAIQMLATATGTEDVAQAMMAQADAALTALDTVLAQVDTTKTVYLGGNSDLLSTAGAKMYQNTLLEQGGASNVAASIEDTYWATISYEQLLTYNPDCIVLAPAAGYSVDDVLVDENLQSLTCIQSGDVFAMPSNLEAWDSPLPGSYLGSLWLASTLYPDLYSYENFMAETVDFYSTFYGFTPDTLD